MKVWLRFASFGLVGLILLAFLAVPVLAQDRAVLAVEPMMGSVEMNGQEQLRFVVSGAQNLNAFEVRVNYDADLLSVGAWEFGDLLSNLALVRLDDEPGSFRIVATQLATPGVSGNGVLLKLTFRGKALGTSPITIAKAEFARSDGGTSSAEVRNGTLTVIEGSPTTTFTSIPTQRPQDSPTPAPTSTKSPTQVGGATLTSIPTQRPQISATPVGEAILTSIPTQQPQIPPTPVGGAGPTQVSGADPTPTPTPVSGAGSEASSGAGGTQRLVVGNERMLENRSEVKGSTTFWALLSVEIIAIVVIAFVIFRRKLRH